MQKTRLAIVLMLIGILAGVFFWINYRDQGRQATRIERGREIAKTAPQQGSAEWMKWYQQLSPEDRGAWAMAEDEKVAAPALSQCQEPAVQIKAWDGSPNNLFKPVILTHYKPPLRMQDATSVRPLQIKTERTNNGLVSTIGARLAQKSLHVNWGAKTVAEATDNSGVGVGPVPQAMPTDMFLTSRGNVIAYKNGNMSFKTPWQPQSSASLVFPLALDAKYRFAFGLVRREENGKTIVDQIVAVDVEQKRVAGLISIPAVFMGVNVVFDPDTEFLLVLDSEWKWMIMLDLKATQ